MRINKKYIAIILLICAFVPFIFNVQKVQAAYSYKSGSDATMDKITKYNASQAIGIFKNSTNISAVKDFLEYGLIGTSKSFVDKDDNCSVPVPNTVMSGTQDKSPTLSCWDFWYGNSNWNALIKGEKSNSDPSNSDAVEYIKPLGYTQDAVSSPGGQKCFKLTWKNPNDTSSSGDAGNFESNTLCVDVDSDGYVWGNSLVDGGESQRESSVAQYRLQRDQSGGVFSSTKYEVIIHSGYNYNPVASVTVQDGDNMKKWSTFEQDFRNEVNNMYTAGVTNNLTLQTWSNSSGSVSNQVTDNTTFTRNKGQTVVSYSGDVLLSEAEVYNIYAKYLTNSSKVKLSCDASYDYNSDAYDWVPVQLKRNGKVDNTCHVRAISGELYTGGQYLSGSYDPVTGNLTSGAYLFNRRNMSLTDIAAAVNKMNLEKLEEDIDDFTGATENVSNGDGESSESDPCYNAGIEGMSWVLCPTIHNTTETIDGMEGALKTMLSIESDKLFGNGNVSYSIWDTFRNIANALLIIIFLIIIFSQLTGYGIDNYGIKKVLPKLIIMAILINLSYIICELAVDLSNILGVGLSNLFEGIAKGAGNTDMPLGDIVTAILVAAAGAAAASGAVITVVSLVSGGGGVMLIITLVLALLSALVAILMFLVMVGARMVIVIVFTAISPVAFALYILPNTQNLFKKWWKVFEAALVVYPICGALYGAHYIVKAIIVGQGGEVNFFMAIAALIAPFLPFLVLPSLLRGALAGLGAVAGAITAAGSGLRRGFARGDSAIKSTEAYKNAQQNSQERKAQNVYNKYKEKLKGGEGLTAAERRRYLRAGAITQKAQKDAESVYGDYFANQGDRKAVQEALGNSLKGNDAQKTGAAFNTLASSGATSEIFEEIGKLSDDDWNKMDAGVQNRLLQGMSSSNIDALKAFAVYKRQGGQSSFTNWVNGSTDKTGDSAKGVKSEYSSYAQHLAQNGGAKAMNGYSKDEMKLVESHVDDIKNEIGGDAFGAMLGSMESNSNDTKAQAVAERIMTDQLSKGRSKGGLDVDQLRLTNENLASLRDEGALAIRNGVTQLYERNVPGISHDQAAADAQRLIRSELDQQIKTLDQTNLSKMRQSTKDMLGV